MVALAVVAVYGRMTEREVARVGHERHLVGRWLENAHDQLDLVNGDDQSRRGPHWRRCAHRHRRAGRFRRRHPQRHGHGRDIRLECFWIVGGDDVVHRWRQSSSRAFW